MTIANQATQLVARFYIKPSGQQQVDFLLAEGTSLIEIMNIMKTDGWLYNAYNAIPLDSVLWVTTMPAPPQPADKPLFQLVPFKKDPPADKPA